MEHEVLPASISRRKDALDDKSQVDIVRKQMEDPLMQIKQREMEQRRKILENPVKLKELHRLLKQEKVKEKTLPCQTVVNFNNFYFRLKKFRKVRRKSPRKRIKDPGPAAAPQDQKTSISYYLKNTKTSKTTPRTTRTMIQISLKKSS